MAEAANYFDRGAFLRHLPHELVETLYQMYLRSGGSGAITSNLSDINTSVSAVESEVASAAGGSGLVSIDVARRAVDLLRSQQLELGALLVELDSMRRDIDQLKAMQ